jgi:hypothetical protein
MIGAINGKMKVVSQPSTGGAHNPAGELSGTSDL